MLYVNLPTREELLQLAEVRSDACISIYLNVSTLPQDRIANRTELNNMFKKALAQLTENGFDKRRLWALEETFASIIQADDFWFFHANSLAVLATPESIRTYRLANTLTNQIHVADRFYIKPLFRALTHPHSGYILSLSENGARLIEFFAQGAPQEIEVPNMPENEETATGRTSIDAGTLGTRRDDSELRGSKMRLTQYARQVDEAIRPIIKGTDTPLFVISTEPLDSIYRSVCSTANLVSERISRSPDRLSIGELVNLARPVLDRFNAAKLDEVRALFDVRKGQRRVATDLSDIAKAATFGMVALLLVDFDWVEKGFIDDNGVLTFSDEPGAYGVIDEIVKRAFASGADVLAVRREDMVGDSGVAAILRYTF